MDDKRVENREKADTEIDLAPAVEVRAARAEVQALFQTPPDVKVVIAAPKTHVVHSVGVGPTSRGTFTSETEFWRQAEELKSDDFGDTLTFTMTPFSQNESQGSLEEHFTGTASGGITAGRPNPRWTEGARTIASGRTAFLYRMVDPDSGANPNIGVLFELEGDTLLAVVFYRSTVRSDGQIWATRDFTKTLTKVRDGNNDPTTNPAHIDGAGSWTGFHTVMGS